jgi:hypothetical protein
LGAHELGGAATVKILRLRNARNFAGRRSPLGYAHRLCRVETKEPHAVLLCKDESGADWILDNRQPTPYTLDEFRGLGYSGVSLQVPGRAMWETWRT